MSLTIDEVHIVEDAAEYSYYDLYKMITQHSSIIIVVEAIDIERIKKGISNVKHKEKKRNTDAGIFPEDERVDYVQLPWTSSTEQQSYGNTAVKLQISLTTISTVPIKKIIIADNEV